MCVWLALALKVSAGSEKKLYEKIVIDWHHSSQTHELIERILKDVEGYPLTFLHQFWKNRWSFQPRNRPDFVFYCRPEYTGPTIGVERFLLVGPRAKTLPKLRGATTLHSLASFYEHLWKAQLPLVTRGDRSVPHELERKAWSSYLKLGPSQVPVAPFVYIYPEGAKAGLEKANELKAFFLVDADTWRREAYRLNMDVWMEGLAELSVPCFFFRPDEPSQALHFSHHSVKQAFANWVWIHQTDPISGFSL